MQIANKQISILLRSNVVIKSEFRNIQIFLSKRCIQVENYVLKDI